MGGRLRRGQTESDVRRFAAPGVATPIATQPQGGVLQKPTASPWELIDTTSQSPERANQFPRSPIVTPKELTRPFRARSRMDLCSRGGAPGYLRTPRWGSLPIRFTCSRALGSILFILPILSSGPLVYPVWPPGAMPRATFARPVGAHFPSAASNPDESGTGSGHASPKPWPTARGPTWFHRPHLSKERSSATSPESTAPRPPPTRPRRKTFVWPSASQPPS